MPRIDAVYFDSGAEEDEGEEEEEEDGFLVYLHGGAFTLCDSGDLLVGSGLLPLLGRRKVSMYAITYSLSSTDIRVGHFPVVSGELIECFDSIRTLHGGKAGCVGLLGDSAGGNAALNLAQQLAGRGEAVPPLALISPWCDTIGDHAALRKIASEPTYHDILNVGWVQASSKAYLGSLARRPEHMGLLHDDKGQPLSTKQLADKFCSLLAEGGFKCVAVDMDQTAVSAHSRGALRRSRLSAYLDKVTPDFVELVRSCLARGVGLAMATHSDEAEYGTKLGGLNNAKLCVMGQELASQVAKTALPDGADNSSIFIAAYNPRARRDTNPNNAGKQEHVRRAAAHFGCDPSQVLLLDDDAFNCKCGARGAGAKDMGFGAIKVDGRVGLKIDAALLALFDLVYPTRSPPSLSSSSLSAAMGLASPLFMSDDSLHALRRVLVITGEDELLAPENFDFVRRLTSPDTKDEQRAEVIHLLAEDIHAYVLHHQNPLRLVARAAGMEWLYSALNPQQARAHAEMGCDSPSAHAALMAIAAFLSKPKPDPEPVSEPRI